MSQSNQPAQVGSTDGLGRWVSVGDRLPDSDGPVLVYTPKNKHAKVWIDCWSMQREAPVSFSSATIETGFMWDGFEFEDVTHWMPLPAAPEGGCTFPQCDCDGPGPDGGCGSAERPNAELNSGRRPSV
jgi:Protein of unknown function (DUF551)